ncbi:MAG: DUF4129 domain-containing protein [Armatimonadetes bacterium]|nr:DUF4129 domain-containing protein [Armatimonadota bacterium]
MGKPRRDHETELEFAQRVPDYLRVKTGQVQRLARLYVACEYGYRLPRRETLDEVRQMWALLVASARQARDLQGAARG